MVQHSESGPGSALFIGEVLLQQGILVFLTICSGQAFQILGVNSLFELGKLLIKTFTLFKVTDDPFGTFRVPTLRQIGRAHV